MANNYLQPVNNHFDFNSDNLDDVDDEIFLDNSRTKQYSGQSSLSSGAVGGSSSGRSTNPFDEPQQLYAEKRRQIEERTLESTQKSLGLLYETEEVGKATAIELAKQREQLEKTSQQLDEINSTLRFSQRHLNGIKSLFGGLKNYMSGSRETQSPRMPTSPSGSQLSQGTAATTVKTSDAGAAPISTKARYDDHPISRLREDSTAIKERSKQQQLQRNNPFEAQIQNNLEEMCDSLTSLKFLATSMGTEIESQNELLDTMNYKIEDVDLKMTKQNKEMYKLLGGKK